MKNGHVRLAEDTHYYSVPCKYIGEKVKIHSDVGSYITKVIENKNHPEQAYKSVQDILSFARRVGEKRLINACRWAESYGLYNYPAIETTPEHKNIRGPEYYN